MSNTRPLILLSISTLLLYAKEFEKNGFEYYFEQYYKSIKKAKNQKEIDPFLACANLSVSFSEYMQNVHPKNFADTYESYKNKIFPESTTSNNN